MVRMSLIVASCCALTFTGAAAAQTTPRGSTPDRLERQLETMRDQLNRMTLDADRLPRADRVASLESRLRDQELQIAALRAEVKGADQRASLSLVLMLYAGVCALWARNSGRGAATWFILGLVFNVFAMGFLLFYNNKDREAEAAASPSGQG
jgi:hypothetical protein